MAEQQFVKQFIEQNIIYIETNNWHEVFTAFYYNSSNQRDINESCFDELLATLNEAGCLNNGGFQAVNIARRKIIDIHIEAILKDILKDKDRAAFSSLVPLEYFTNRLKSFLGFSRRQIDYFVVDFMSKTPYNYDPSRIGFII